MTAVRPLLAALALPLAAACSYVPPKQSIPQDGAMSRQITWVLTDDPQTACDQVSGARRTLLPYRTLGCASWKDKQNCVIYVKAPRDEHDRRAMETLGHEVLHCFAGHFHRPPN